MPNSKDIDADFKQYEIDAEAEGRYTLWDHDGKLKILGFVNRGRMGSYEDSVALGRATGTIPNTRWCGCIARGRARRSIWSRD